MTDIKNKNRESASFDLEKEIASWSRSLRRQSGIEDGDAADLEGYLRDKVEDLVREGLGPKEAFEKAEREFAASDALGDDYDRSRAVRRSGRLPGRPPRFLPALIWNYAKIALRKLRRQKVYAFINIAGLAVGLAACLLILLWVKDELSYDAYHEKADRIYRVTLMGGRDGASKGLAVTPFASAPAFASEIPEVETYARLFYAEPLAVVEGRKVDLKDIYFTDPGFFDIFTHRFLAGEPSTALARPGALVLTEETARKLFGRTDVLGRTVNFDKDSDLKVTAVIKDVPANSHFRFKGLASLATIATRPEMRPYMEDWLRITGWVYVLLRDGAAPGAVEAKMAAVTLKRAGDDFSRPGGVGKFCLQPLASIHLRSHIEAEIKPTGDIRYVFAFSLIVAFILVLAGVNFMNLSTARSAGRGREVGLRKVMGARRGNLILQFLGESVLLTAVAAAVAVLLVVLALPSFNHLAGKQIGPSSLLNGGTLLLLAALVLLTGLLGGCYPALFMSAFRPAAVLKGMLGRGMKRGSFRSALVVFQFTVSIILMACTWIVLAQTRYMKTRELGFDKDRVLVVQVRDEAARRAAPALASDLRSSPNVRDTSLTAGVPGRITTRMFINMEGRPEQDSFPVDFIWSDHDFVKTYGITIVKGRDFSRSMASDAAGVYLVNETAARRMGWGDDAIGRKIGNNVNAMKPIVGIMKDFHTESLKEPIGPLVVRLATPEELMPRAGFLSLKLRGGDIPATLAYVKSKWAQRSERGFEYFFADQTFDSLYRSEERFGRIIAAFSVMAVFVACLGLFGLASYAAEQRTKEIGIRKVMGASEAGLVAHLSKDFLKWVLLANAIALPSAYLITTRLWLVKFAYRSTPGVLIFAAVAGLSLLVALLTVSGQTVRAALANPADSVRYE
jgi:putative ABC transport system permease protein